MKGRFLERYSWYADNHMILSPHNQIFEAIQEIMRVHGWYHRLDKGAISEYVSSIDKQDFLKSVPSSQEDYLCQSILKMLAHATTHGFDYQVLNTISHDLCTLLNLMMHNKKTAKAGRNIANLTINILEGFYN